MDFNSVDWRPGIRLVRWSSIEGMYGSADSQCKNERQVTNSENFGIFSQSDMYDDIIRATALLNFSAFLKSATERHDHIDWSTKKGIISLGGSNLIKNCL